MDYWPQNLHPPPAHTTRPPLSLTNVFLTHFLNDTRPHIVFIPCCRTFKGDLLSNVYWNDNPVKMVEKRHGQYRAVNSEALRDLFHCLNMAQFALQFHVYPLSMQGRLNFLRKDIGGMGRWHQNIKRAVYYGWRNVTCILEMLGLVTMMVALLQLQSRQRDTWWRVVANELYF
jgi:hypothetical protein